MLNKLGAVHMAADVLTIPTLFNEAAARNYDKVALQAKKDNQWLRLTYGDLETASLKVAYFLIREGLKKGDAAGIVLENRPEWLIIYLGMMYAGLACVPLDPQLGVSDLRGFILNSQARIVFTSRTLFDEKFKPFLERDALRFVILDYAGSKEPNALDFAELENSPSGALALPQVLAQDIASLIYTSGTTAQPKAVLLSHGNICSNFKSIAKLNICFPSDNILSILPLYHAYSFMVTLMVPVLLGAKATFALSFKPKDLSQIIREAKVTILPGVPQLFSLLHKAILEKIKNIPSILLPLGVAFIRPSLRSRLGRDLRLLVSGGARLEPKIARDLTRILGVKLVEGYGLTETSPVVTLNPVEKIKFGSVGKPIPGVQISILNPDKSGIGQVLIKGPNVMEGYFKQPQLTAEAVKDGWFYSGDAGYIDKEGYLFLSGREKDIIVLSSGKNVYPEELEHHYAKSPYIKEI
jgi:long-chain acyl-CoA synthetase